jgi:hypothetical protein
MSTVEVLGLIAAAIASLAVLLVLGTTIHEKYSCADGTVRAGVSGGGGCGSGSASAFDAPLARIEGVPGASASSLRSWGAASSEPSQGAAGQALLPSNGASGSASFVARSDQPSMAEWVGDQVMGVLRTLMDGPARNLDWSTVGVTRTDKARSADEARVRGMVSRLPPSVRRELEAEGVEIMVAHDSIVERHPTLRGVEVPGSDRTYDEEPTYYREDHKRIVVAASRATDDDLLNAANRALDLIHGRATRTP